VVSFAFLVRHRAWKSLTGSVVALCLAIAFLLLLNVAGSPIDRFRRIPLLSRLGEIADVKRGSPGWVRIEVWKGILDGWRRQLRGEEILPGLPPRVRSMIGFGPESQRTVLAPLTSSSLRGLQARTETWRANYTIDRAHNSLLDHLVTEGLVGSGLYVLFVG